MNKKEQLKILYDMEHTLKAQVIEVSPNTIMGFSLCRALHDAWFPLNGRVTSKKEFHEIMRPIWKLAKKKKVLKTFKRYYDSRSEHWFDKKDYKIRKELLELRIKELEKEV